MYRLRVYSLGPADLEREVGFLGDEGEAVAYAEELADEPGVGSVRVQVGGETIYHCSAAAVTP